MGGSRDSTLHDRHLRAKGVVARSPGWCAHDHLATFATNFLPTGSCVWTPSLGPLRADPPGSVPRPARGRLSLTSHFTGFLRPIRQQPPPQQVEMPLTRLGMAAHGRRRRGPKRLGIVGGSNSPAQFFARRRARRRSRCRAVRCRPVGRSRCCPSQCNRTMATARWKPHLDWRRPATSCFIGTVAVHRGPAYRPIGSEPVTRRPRSQLRRSSGRHSGLDRGPLPEQPSAIRVPPAQGG
jgi:hypothetical protein